MNPTPAEKNSCAYVNICTAVSKQGITHKEVFKKSLSFRVPICDPTPTCIPSNKQLTASVGQCTYQFPEIPKYGPFSGVWIITGPTVTIVATDAQPKHNVAARPNLVEGRRRKRRLNR